MEKEAAKEEWIVIDFGDLHTTVFKADKDDCNIVLLNNTRQNASIIAYTEEKSIFGELALSSSEPYIANTARLIKTRIGEYNDFTCFVKDGGKLVAEKLNSREVIAHYIYDIIQKTGIKNILFVHPIYWEPGGNQMRCLTDAFEILGKLVDGFRYELIDSMSAMAWNIFINNDLQINGKIAVFDSGYSHTTASIFKIGNNTIENEYTAVIDFGGMDITCAVANYVYNKLKNASTEKWKIKEEGILAKEILAKIAKPNNLESKRLHKLFLNEAQNAKEKLARSTEVAFNGSTISSDTEFVQNFKFGDIYNTQELQPKFKCLDTFINRILQHCCNDVLITTEIRGGNCVSCIFQEVMKGYRKKTSTVLSVYECFALGAALMKNMELQNVHLKTEKLKDKIDYIRVPPQQKSDTIIFTKEQPPTALYRSGSETELNKDAKTIKKLIEVNEFVNKVDELSNEMESFANEKRKIAVKFKKSKYDPKKFVELYQRVADLPKLSYDKSKYNSCKREMDKIKKEMSMEYERQTKILFDKQQNYKQCFELLKECQSFYNAFYKTNDKLQQPTKVEGVGKKTIYYKNEEKRRNHKTGDFLIKSIYE